jgi:hypothetical protein
MGLEEEKKFLADKSKGVATNTDFNKILESNYDFFVKNIIETTPLGEFFKNDPSLYDFLKKTLAQVMKMFMNSGLPVVLASNNARFVKTAQGPLTPAEIAIVTEGAEALAGAEGAGLAEAAAGEGIGLPSGGATGGGAGSPKGFDLARFFGPSQGSGIDGAKFYDKLLQGDYQGLADVIIDGKLGKEHPAAPFAKSTIKYLIPRIQRVLQQTMNPEMIRRTYLLDTMKDFGNKRQKYEFSPSAFEHLLETKGARGYLGEEHSQGAYEARGKEITDEIAKFKKSDPDKFKHEYSYLDDPDVKERLEKTSSSKFKKIAQSKANNLPKLQRTEETDKMYSSLKQLLPKWDVQTLKDAMIKVSLREDLTEEQKSQLMVQTINPYIKSVEPLNKYINKIKSGK